jgi:hypothetical protein
MTNTFRKTWVTIFSIIAMLISSYASSSSVMIADVITAQVMSSQAACYQADAPDTVSTDVDMNAVCHIDLSDSRSHTASDSNTHHSEMNGHSVVGDAKAIQHDLSMTTHGEDMMSNHCLGGSDSVHNCCISVCSTASHPIQTAQAINQIAFSLARYHSVTIGQKVTRVQSLLRPPSA